MQVLNYLSLLCRVQDQSQGLVVPRIEGLPKSLYVIKTTSNRHSQSLDSHMIVDAVTTLSLVSMILKHITLKP